MDVREKGGLTVRCARPCLTCCATAALPDHALACQVEEARAKGAFRCPQPRRIASLEVPNLWIPRGRKFDHRVYVLVGVWCERVYMC